jgi:hypothetical protein
VVLLLWSGSRPRGRRPPVGKCGLETEDRALAEERGLATDGGVHGLGDAALILPDSGEYAVAVWRRLEPGETFKYWAV